MVGHCRLLRKSEAASADAAPFFHTHFCVLADNSQVAKDINVIALVKGEERYVFLFRDDTRAETLRTLGRYASNPELSFSWYDAAVLSQKVRRTVDLTPAEYELDEPLMFEEEIFDEFLFED